MRYYIYKLTFENGCTYIGFHYEKKPDDGYVTSSSYFKKNPSLKYKKEILIELQDRETASIMETLCIMADKCGSEKNVNYNLGNWFHHFNCSYLSEEHRKKIGEASKKNWTEERKLKHSKRMSGTNNPMYGKSRKGETHNHFSEEGKQNVSKGLKDYYNSIEGKETIQKVASKKKGKILINNGVECKSIYPNEPIPEGWTKGRLLSNEGLKKLQEIGSRKKEPHIYITNGFICKAIKPTDEIPEGWKRGRKTNGFCNTKTD